MSNMRIAVLAAGLMVSFTAARGYAMEKLNVMISGGFSQAYHDVLPDFERSTGISVTTLSGASQGTGPKTIKSQLENGADVDVVILSKEGLSELIAAKRIVGGSERELASVPLAAAVRQGSPKPDIGNVEGFKTALLNARLVVMPGSTSGLFVKDEVFPKLGIANKVSFKVVARRDERWLGTEPDEIAAAAEALRRFEPEHPSLAHLEVRASRAARSMRAADRRARVSQDVHLVDTDQELVFDHKHDRSRRKRMRSSGFRAGGYHLGPRVSVSAYAKLMMAS